MTKEEFYKAVKSANLKDSMWIDNLIKQIDNKYVQGYLTCFANNLNHTISVGEEEFREEVLDTKNYDIWN